jgi:hypothetical protein
MIVLKKALKKAGMRERNMFIWLRLIPGTGSFKYSSGLLVP